MTDTLRAKLIQKGWTTEFNADTLTCLIEEHYAALADEPAEPPLYARQTGIGQWEGADHPSGPWRKVLPADLARWGNPAPQPAAVTGQLSDEELLKLAQQYSVVYLPSDGSACNPFQEGYDMRNDVLNFARAVLARWGHQPAPPADGEAAECTAELEEQKPRPDYDRVQKIATEAQIRSAAQYLAKKQHCDGDLIPAIRYAIARWGNPAPQLPTDGEVAEVMGLFRHWAEAYPDSVTVDPYWLTRAADLLQRLSPPQPVPVSERLPGPSVKVLAHYFNGLGKERTICAIWVPAKTRSDSYGDDDFTEYDEESDTFYWPEGWYETIENWDDLGYVKVVEGEVIYWQPIPKWPAHALPLPEVGA